MPRIRIALEPRDPTAATLRRESVFPVPDDGMIVLQLPVHDDAKNRHARLMRTCGRFIHSVRDEGRLDAALFHEMAEAYDEIDDCTKTEGTE